MQVRVQGSGGARGWPEPGCRCASCQRARFAGAGRAPFSVIVDGILRLDGAHAAVLTGNGPPPEYGQGTGRELAGYRVRRLAGGWDVTAPDGGRLLCADGPGPGPAVPPRTRRYDVALLDLLGDPAQLGRLRSQGVVTSGTAVAVAFADHRVVSERELLRRGHIWRVAVPRDGDTFCAPAPDEAPAPGAAPRTGAAPAAGAAPAPGAAAAAGERPVPYRVLVLGGARSGKSAEAELRVAAEPVVTYVATGSASPDSRGGDAEWAARIAAHRSRRPSWWRTLETTDLPGALRQARGAVLVDSITAWLAAVMDECGAWDGAAASAARLGQRIAGLVAQWRQASAYVVAVSDETGLSIVPATPSGRMFRDELGRLNQLLAAESDEFIVIVAGQATVIGGQGSSCG